MTAPFDTLKFARALRQEAKLSQLQAEGVVTALSGAMRDGLATTADLQAVKAELQAVKAELQADVQAVRDDLNAVKDDLNAVKGDLNAVKADVQAVKADVQAVRVELQAVSAELNHKIESVEDRLKVAIADTRSDILKWVISAIGFQTIMLIGAAIALARVFHG